ncbi:hypothetical protein NMY22_g5091 [Coprinellus aureogranulatus]|nr:hypothetical protein NMY22_g5091 [Coprinellus aureogranulatus]
MSEPDLEKGSNAKASRKPTDRVRVDGESQPPPNDRSVRKASSMQNIVKNIKNRKKSTPIDFRDNARVWQLYLEEAEDIAKYKAASWNTTLDTLLIFAGLFAGVVSSFIIDARKDLQPHNEERLLSSIFDWLRSRSVDDKPFDIPRTTTGVSALWMVSLLTTIFSAIMGVLAKAWLAKYVPASTRREARDAYRRYQLDGQAERWHLKEVLIFVPMLVQGAAILFLIGLILQLRDDSPVIALVLLILSIIAGIIYAIVTISPLIDPSSPFNTPLSEIWDAFFGPAKEEKAPFKTDMNDGLADILYTRLIQSPKPHHVDEAVTEIALAAFPPRWIHFLSCDDTHTPNILLERFRQCLASLPSDTPRRDEMLHNYLLALHSFGVCYDDLLSSTQPDDLSSKLGNYSRLVTVLKASLEPGNPLHRWNELPEALRPLLFALRANVILLLNLSQRGDSSATPIDFDTSEVLDRPWEMLFREIRSTDRIHFTIAACRGLVEGQDNLKTISSFSLSLFLAKAALMASETGQTSEWASTVSKETRDAVYWLASQYLSSLYDATVKGWDTSLRATGTSDALTFFSPTGSLGETKDIDISGRQPKAKSPGEAVTPLDRADDLRILILQLWQQNHVLRIHATKVFKHASSAKTPALFCQFFIDSVESIASAVAYDDEDIQEGGFELLTELSVADGEIAQAIKTTLVSRIRSAFREYENQPRANGPFYSIFTNIIPRLVEVALEEESTSDRVRLLAVKLLQHLQSKGFSGIKEAILYRLGELLDSALCHNCINALRHLLTGNSPPQRQRLLPLIFPWRTSSEFLEEFVSRMFVKVLEIAVYHESVDETKSARELLASISQDATVPQADRRVRSNALQILEMFIDHVQTSDVSWLLKRLILMALKDDQSHIRSGSLHLASAICKEDTTMINFASTIKEAFISNSPENIVCYTSHNAYSRDWVPFLLNVAKHVSFPEIVPFLVQNLRTERDNRKMREAIAEFLTSDQSIHDSTVCEGLRKLIPDDLTVILPGKANDNYDMDTKCQWVRVLEALLPMAPFHEIASDALDRMRDAVKVALNTFPVAITECGRYLDPAALRLLLTNAGGSISPHWADILATMASLYPKDFPDVTNALVAVAKGDSAPHVRAETLQSLSVLVNSAEILEAMVEARLTYDHGSVRIAFARLVGDFVRRTHDALPESVIRPLNDMARFDNDRRVRREAVYALAAMAADAGKYPCGAQLALEAFNIGINDFDWESREAWLQVIVPSLKDGAVTFLAFMKLHDILTSSWDAGRLSYLGQVVHVAIWDRTNIVREAALNILVGLTERSDSNTYSICLQGKRPSARQDSAVAIDETHMAPGAVTCSLTLGGYALAPTGDSQAGFNSWIRMIIFLGRNEYQGVAKLVQCAVLENGTFDFDDLEVAFQSVAAQDPIQVALPTFIEYALDLDASVSPDIRLEAVELLRRLAGVEEDGVDYDGLLSDNTNDSQIIMRLCEIAVKDTDGNLKGPALDLLKSILTDIQDIAEDAPGHACRTGNRFSNLVKIHLTELVESCFRDPDLMKFRSNAITILRQLTDPGINGLEDCETFKDIVSPSVSHLLKVALFTADKDLEHLREQAESVLLENLTAYATETKINRDVLFTIPSMIPAITVEGRRIVLQLAETMHLSDDTLANITPTFAQLLRTTTSSFARATAIEFLSRLYLAKGELSKPYLIESAIPEIIALALDEKDDVGGIRTTAIRLLVALSSDDADNADDASSRRVSPTVRKTPVLKQLIPLATRFMDLLQIANLRPCAVELLSLLATELDVRRTISLQIISLAFGTDTSSLQGHTELLARLIADDCRMDSRFTSEPIDNVILFLTSAMITRPNLAHYRFEILPALWCHYGRKSIIPVNHDTEGEVAEQNDLVVWFILALFGRHATDREVMEWSKRCKAIWGREDEKRKRAIQDQETAGKEGEPAGSHETPSIKTAKRSVNSGSQAKGDEDRADSRSVISADSDILAGKMFNGSVRYANPS